MNIGPASLPVVIWTACYGWLALVVASAWWCTRRLPAELNSEPEPKWARRPLGFRLEPLDQASLCLLAGLALMLWLAREQFIPRPPDGYYHITVAREILRTGCIPLWDAWELAPYGRPHLYPPGFHLLMAALSWPSGDALHGFRAVSALLPSVALGAVWYLARWLFDARRGFLALLITGMDAPFMAMGLMAIPALLAGAMLAFMLALFLSKRPVAAAILAALAMYMHLGMAPFVFLGLFLFTLQRREYLLSFFGVLALTLLLIAPWYAHIWTYREWFGHPIDRGLWGEFSPGRAVLLKLTWMLVLNVALAIVLVRAARIIRWGEARNRLLLSLAIAFLPVWLSYGGRYWANTIPYWSILGAALFAPLLAKPLRLRRIAAALLLALCPTAAVITGFGGLVPNGAYPMISGWMLPPATAVAGRAILDASCEAKWNELEELGRYIRENTQPGQIIYCLDVQSRQLAAMIGYHAERPIATAVWEEAWPDPSIERMLDWNVQHDPKGVLVRRAGRFVSGNAGERAGFTRSKTWTPVGGFQVHISSQ